MWLVKQAWFVMITVMVRTQIHKKITGSVGFVPKVFRILVKCSIVLPNHWAQVTGTGHKLHMAVLYGGLSWTSTDTCFLSMAGTYWEWLNCANQTTQSWLKASSCEVHCGQACGPGFTSPVHYLSRYATLLPIHHILSKLRLLHH